jgi:hypothetical protein
MAAKPTPKPKAKPKGLNDFLKKGKTPPSKNKKLPSDADVIIKGYNDKKTAVKSAKKVAAKMTPASKTTSMAAAKPKPAPSPTAVSQLKNVRGTLMSIPKDEQGNSLRYTAKDKNVYTGTYKGKEYTWKNGKFVK